MSIPLILVYGHRTRLAPLGWTASLCKRCEKIQPHECSDQLRSDHIYFIHGKERTISLVLTCDFCETSTGLSPNSKEAKSLRLSRTWRSEDGVQALADETNPALGYVFASARPTDKELVALLQSINERSSSANVNVQGGMMLGGAVGAVVCGVLVPLLSAIDIIPLGDDTLGNIFLGVLPGGGIGCIVGAVRAHRRQSREIVRTLLAYAVERHDLEVYELQRALAQSRKSFGRIADGLRRFALATGVAQYTSPSDSQNSDDSNRTPVAHTTARTSSTTTANPPRNVCAQCGLVNFASAAACKRCDTALQTVVAAA